MMILVLSLVINLKSFLFFWFLSIIIIFIFHFVWLVGYYTWIALPLLVISMFFTHVIILLKVCYVISDKHKYISLVVVVVVVVIPEVGRKGEWGGGWLRTPLWKTPWNFSCFYFTYHCKFQTKQSAKLHPWKFQKLPKTRTPGNFTLFFFLVTLGNPTLSF